MNWPTLRRYLVASAAAVTATALIATATPATANTSDNVTANEVATAIATTERSNGKLIVEPVKSITDADSAAVTTQNGTTVDVPNDPTDGVQIESQNGTSITIGLPNANEVGSAKKLADGTVVYPGSDGTANAVIASQGAVQMLTVIENKGASESFEYSLGDLPKGAKVRISPSGGAVVLDTDGQLITAAPKPWAKDANGKLLKTHFTTDGTTLTQYVSHKGANIAYPVTADPRFQWGQWGVTVFLNRGETDWLSYGTAAAAATLPWVGWAFAGYVAYMADRAHDRGQCLAYWKGYIAGFDGWYYNC